jgi:Rrf2 family protein
MKLSTRGRYALRIMLDIARNGEKGPVSLTDVAARTGISRGYLEQLASVLRNARLLKSTSGRYGGYRLARPAEKITIGEIIENSIGPICVVDCIDDPTGCPRSEMCECRVVYGLINNRIVQVLREYTLQDLLDPSWAQNVPQL